MVEGKTEVRIIDYKGDRYIRQDDIVLYLCRAALVSDSWDIRKALESVANSISNGELLDNSKEYPTWMKSKGTEK